MCVVILFGLCCVVRAVSLKSSFFRLSTFSLCMDCTHTIIMYTNAVLRLYLAVNGMLRHAMFLLMLVVTGNEDNDEDLKLCQITLLIIRNWHSSVVNIYNPQHNKMMLADYAMAVPSYCSNFG